MNNFELAQEKYEAVKNKEPERENAKKLVQRLEELQPIIASLAEKQLNLQNAEIQLRKIKRKYAKLRSTIRRAYKSKTANVW